MTLRARTAFVATVLALACGGCGLGAGPGTKGVTLTVTRGFGSQQIARIGSPRVPGSETVMRMLERSFHITTRYGGGFLESIDGLGPTRPQTDWFYYVNGILAPKGAAGTTVHAGDHIWWDMHDYRATQTIPAVVGSFPEPFVHGIGGKRYPVTIECGTDVDTACKRVTAAMNAVNVPAAPQLLGTGSGPDTLGIVVGTWREISSQVGAELVANGPGASGVYARFEHHGSELALLNPSGHVARTLGAGAGLIAATADSSSVPTWMITGVDVAGVTAAARALSARALHNHFALAVDGGTERSVPVQGSP
ncbi:MAG TPA: DUF4430 domain-containing protein [Solirubrobacteraceae bacterium]|jgi:hypothetical protein|nr:DUF4430 domain-containing protein [Solirubrobacteraceae bacterium]